MARCADCHATGQRCCRCCGYLLLHDQGEDRVGRRKARLPAIFSATEYHDAGILISYGPNLNDTGRAFAIYVVAY